MGKKTDRMDTMTIIDIFIAALWVAMFYGVARDIKRDMKINSYNQP